MMDGSVSGRRPSDDEVAQMSVRDKCVHIIHQFDHWLAVQALWLKLGHKDLPELNDAFRDYFSDTRTARGPGSSR